MVKTAVLPAPIRWRATFHQKNERSVPARVIYASAPQVFRCAARSAVQGRSARARGTRNTVPTTIENASVVTADSRAIAAFERKE